MKTTLTKIASLILGFCMMLSMLTFPVSAADVTAEIILETTNAAPAEGELVPLEETLKVSITGAEATGYRWYAVRGDETMNYALSTEAEFVAPANMYEKYGSSTKVFCEVTYDGGTLTTPTVTMEQYVHNIPYGWDYKNGNNHYKGVPNAENSDSDYVFYVDGKGFVVLKEQNVKDSAYLVMALDAYGDIFSGDNADSKSATEWKNIYGQTGYGVDGTTTMETKLLGDGNTFDSLAEDGDATYALPEAFDAYIDMNHKWPRAVDKWGTVGEFIAGVTIPSYSEYVNYADRLGYTDNLQAVSTSTDVLLRDLYGTGDQTTTTIGKVISGRLSTSNAAGPYLLRPCFWLGKDFFEKNAIDIETAGSGVKEIIKNEAYTNKTNLKATYQAADMMNDYYSLFPEETPAEINAEIILETTNEAPTAAVPLAETLKVKVENATPTAYAWYSKGQTTDYKIGEGESFVAPANLYEKYGKATAVYCKVIYNGGTIITEPVAMEEYVHNIPYGWDYKDGNNHYKGIPNGANSDSRYIFYVDGKGFVLAKEQNVKGAAYFVMALDAYGDIFTGDNADAKSQTEWKNVYGESGFGNDNGTTMVTKLLGEGNTFESLVADSAKTYALPDAFDAFIDADHSWGYAKDKWGTVAAMTSPIAIPSYSDYVNYADRVGHIDNLRAEAGDAPVLLRDLYGTASPTTMGKIIRNGLSTSDAAGPYLVRPCFWLSKDFFEKNAIDLAKTGSKVIELIMNEEWCNRAVLQQTYIDAGKQNEYNLYLNPDVKLNVTVRKSGAAADTVKMYESLKAELAGVDGELVYTWQIQNESGWETLTSENVNANILAITPALAGKTVRARVAYQSFELVSDAIVLPAVEVFTEAPGATDAPKRLSNPENSAAERLFTVDGKGFVLLEAFDNDVISYYATTTEAYGTANYVVSGAKDAAKAYTAYGTISKDDNADSLDELIMYSGNNFAGIIGANNKKYKLPEAIVNGIYKDNTWSRYVHPDWAGSPYWVSKTSVDSVQMLSQTDFTKYSSILGYKDNVFENGGECYLLRDSSDKVGAWYTNSAVSVDGKSIQIDQWPENAGSKTPVVRPAFYLKGDFFKTTAIDDIGAAGSDVINIMKEKYFVEDLEHLYPASTLVNLGFERKLRITAQWADNDGGAVNLDTATSVTVNMLIENAHNEEQKAVLVLSVYDESGKCIGMDIVTDIVVGANDSEPINCTVSGISGGGNRKAMAMLWSDLKEMIPLSLSAQLD